MESIRLPSDEAVRQAAIAVLSRNPAAPLAQIALRAGVGRATLHRHFPSRAELIREIALDALDATAAALAPVAAAPTARAALEQMFEAMIPLASQYQFLSRCALDDPEVERRYALQSGQLAQLVEGLRREGALAPDVPPAWAVAQIDSLIWTTWAAVERGEIAARSAAALAVRTLLAGIAPA